VVEDNKTNLFLARRILEKKGCRVEVAMNGREGLKRPDTTYSMSFSWTSRCLSWTGATQQERSADSPARQKVGKPGADRRAVRECLDRRHEAVLRGGYGRLYVQTVQDSGIDREVPALAKLVWIGHPAASQYCESF
jgi:hypothetical protein